MTRLCLTLLLLECFSCSTPKKKVQIGLTTYKNHALINEDSCLKWKLPVTSFKIEFPSQFSVKYHHTRNYLTLTQESDSGFVEQEFSFDKLEGIQTDYDVKKWTIKADSMFNKLKTYTSTFVGNETINNKTTFVARGTINSEILGSEKHKGIYSVLIMLIPNRKERNGVTMTYINRLNNEKLNRQSIVDSVINTLEFFKN